MNRLTLKSPAIRVSIISVLVNLLLAAFKLAVGLIGNSAALVADAVHSASDVLTTLIVIVSLFISSRAPDADHEYGHQKYESLAALLLGLLLAQIGIEIGVTGIKALVSGSYKTAAAPTMLAVAAAAASIAVKEIMFHLTMAVAKRERSNALKADAWHHRSDALSSIGSLAGVLFAMNGMPVMDPVASLVICVFILKTAVDIIIDSAKALTDSSCDKKTEQQLLETVLAAPEVLSVDMLKTRVFGSGIYVDVEIGVSRSHSFEGAHGIAEAVHDKIEETFPTVWHCMVHVNPIAMEPELEITAK